MKTFSTYFLGLALTVTLAGRSLADAPTAAPAKAAAPLVAPRSIFTLPNNAHEGRDPFYPESSRVFDSNVAPTTTASATTLKVMGYSVVNGHPTVIINNRTFMIGDENDVTTAGGRAHIRLLEIRSGTVVVDVNGAHHEIHF